MKSFYMRENKDAGNEFLAALLAANYRRVANPHEKAPESGYEKRHRIIEKADFLLFDHDYTYKSPNEWDFYFTPQEIAKRPIFIYPHTPYSWFIWDSVLEQKKITCNFVVSEGAKEAMNLYGYSRPIEVIGFTGTQIKPFIPTQGTRLLFAPAHPLHDSKYPKPEALESIREISKKIVQYLDYFESVTIRYSNSLEACGLEIFENLSNRIIFERINIYRTPNIRQNALTSICQADLVISNSTFAYLSVATGKPTIFYGYKNTVPYSREGYVKNYNLYKHIFCFPLLFEDLSINDIMRARTDINFDVELWKILNIGEQFNANEFVKKLEKYL